MSDLVLKVKKIHPEAQLPRAAHMSDAGYDCFAIDDGIPKYDDKTGVLLYVEYKTGLAIQPPSGYHVELFPRSSITKTGFILANSVGVVDEGFSGEIVFRFKTPISPNRQIQGFGANLYNKMGPRYYKGERIGQMIVRKTHKLSIVEVKELDKTERGEGGFGSTGK